MLRYLGMGAAVAAVAVLAAGSLGPATGSGPGDDDRLRVIRVVTIGEEFGQVDSGDTGPSLGDEFVFTSTLSKGGEEVGHLGVVCTMTSLERQESLCAASAWFDGRGQVTLQGLITEQDPTFSVAITGGTGAFREVGGVVRIRPLSGDRERLTFLLRD